MTPLESNPRLLSLLSAFVLASASSAFGNVGGMPSADPAAPASGPQTVPQSGQADVYPDARPMQDGGGSATQPRLRRSKPSRTGIDTSTRTGMGTDPLGPMSR